MVFQAEPEALVTSLLRRGWASRRFFLAHTRWSVWGTWGTPSWPRLWGLTLVPSLRGLLDTQGGVRNLSLRITHISTCIWVKDVAPSGDNQDSSDLAITRCADKSSRPELFVVSISGPGELSLLSCYYCLTCLFGKLYIVGGHWSPIFTTLPASFPLWKLLAIPSTSDNFFCAFLCFLIQPEEAPALFSPAPSSLEQRQAIHY